MSGWFSQWFRSDGQVPDAAMRRAQRGLPALHGSRMVLREFVSADALSVFELYSDARVAATNAWKPIRNMWQARQQIRRFRRERQNGVKMRWGIFGHDNQMMLGDCAFTRLDPASHSAEISYNLCPHIWGQGIMSEALRLMIGYGFDTLGLEEIEAAVLPENEPSIRLLERLGFRERARARNLRLVRGELREVQLYMLPRAQYYSSQAGGA